MLPVAYQKLKEEEETMKHDEFIGQVQLYLEKSYEV
jgi:DNA-directed RNA polymerase delta subunit